MHFEIEKRVTHKTAKLDQEFAQKAALRKTAIHLEQVTLRRKVPSNLY